MPTYSDLALRALRSGHLDISKGFALVIRPPRQGVADGMTYLRDLQREIGGQIDLDGTLTLKSGPAYRLACDMKS